jgi:ABC-type multidrug transport system fused ATPase/permease subunit
LHTLRSRIALVPQDPIIFTGTVRFNLDPEHVQTEDEIWAVLNQVQIAAHVQGLAGKLEEKLEESGLKFSAGQRQLLSLARALLRNTRILVLDEATASIDQDTDRVLQSMLNGDKLKDRTIITIAHRIETILKSDRVITLENGRMAEFGSPQSLMVKGGLFHDLVVQAGLEDQISNSEEHI